jgi:hypothetical protein
MLNAEQMQQTVALTKAMEVRRVNSLGGFHQLAPKERELRFVEVARAEFDDLRQVLDSRQLGRLRQIALQLQGLRAFRDPDVAAALELTSQQKQKFQALEAFEPTCEPGDDPGPVPGKPPKQKRDLNAIAEMTKKELTSEQWRRWQEMIGAPYTGPPIPIGPPGPFGFHPRGGEGGPGHFGKDKGFGAPGTGGPQRRPGEGPPDRRPSQ